MKRNRWVALSVASLCVVPGYAQQTRPDAGTLLEQERQIPRLPPPGGAPTLTAPQTPPVAPFKVDVKVNPASFRIQGNSLFGNEELQSVLKEYVGKPTDMGGLVQAAAAVRRYYRERGYLLTEAYLPVQKFPANGADILIQVLEARVGKVNVIVEGQGINKSLATSIVTTNLKPGDHISEYSMDKPVLLLRDLTGFDATASVEPGAIMGEADITILVKDSGPKVDGSVGADNFGVSSAGQYRAYASVNLNNPTGNGDQFNVRAQLTERSGTNLFRVGYSVALGGHATRLGVNLARTEYALGGQFAPLGASGEATIMGIAATHPFIRSRFNNVLGALAFEYKELKDRTAAPATGAMHRISAMRASILGNFVDRIAGSSFNSYSVNFTHGNLNLDAATLAADQGTTGLRTAGSFSKLNLEYTRTTFVSAEGRVTASLQGQIASKNLTSAEKFSLGGPQGVRAYPAGEGVGDSGAIVNLEYSHRLPDFGTGIPASASVFYDWGYSKFNQDGAPFPGQTSDTLGAAGFGLTVGSVGKYLFSTHIAWRTDRAPAFDPDRKPRVLFSLQKWL